MIAITTYDAMVAMRGSLVGPDWQARTSDSISGVVTDSRRVNPGDCFVALVGASHDGHDFVAKAHERGGRLFVVERGRAQGILRDLGHGHGALCIEVDDTTAAIGSLAQALRARFTGRVVALTGSLGKTTVKEMLRAIFGRVGSVYATPGNWNNHIGLPLTIFGLSSTIATAIFELGTNAPGEIASLAAIAAPDVALVTTVAPVHLEGLGSVEAVADEKTSIFHGLAAGGRAVFDGDDALVGERVEALGLATTTFGTADDNDVVILGAEAGPKMTTIGRLRIRGEEVTVTIPMLGHHHVHNAAAAAAVAVSEGVSTADIVLGIAATRLVGGRMSTTIRGGVTIIDDSYNASPRSVMAALDTLVALPGRHVAALGEMRELGPDAIAYHEEVGQHAARVGLDLLVAVGTHGQDIARGALEGGLSRASIVFTETQEEAAEVLRGALDKGDALLVKGSRGAAMERVIQALGLERGQG